ncbi:MAG: NUDIX domain-containing protein [bacterium]|nr:NUDIX domain-containing protein [bacterium]
MIKERSCGAVIFMKDEGIKYLLLEYSEGHWEFVKGHVEEGEADLETVERETAEEVSITDLEFVKDFKEDIHYFFTVEKKTISKDVSFYLAETKTKKVSLSFEHNNFTWLSFDDAMKKLTFENAKNVLKKADEFLKKNG